MKNLNVFLSHFLLTAAILVVVPASFARTSNTVIRGNVNDIAGGHWVTETTVTVTCNGTAHTPVTDGNGLYTTTFTRTECPKYENVTSVVTYGGNTQSQTVQVSGSYTATLDFNFGAVGVPEFGLITGVVAAAASFGSFFLLKKRLV